MQITTHNTLIEDPSSRLFLLICFEINVFPSVINRQSGYQSRQLTELYNEIDLISYRIVEQRTKREENQWHICLPQTMPCSLKHPLVFPEGSEYINKIEHRSYCLLFIFCRQRLRYLWI